MQKYMSFDVKSIDCEFQPVAALVNFSMNLQMTSFNLLRIGADISRIMFRKMIFSGVQRKETIFNCIL